MRGQKGAWKRADRVVLGTSTAKRAAKLGYVGEQLAMALLSKHGFTAIKDLNKQTKNHGFADIYAERNGERFWISVKARNKYQIDRKQNYCYKISPGQRMLASKLEGDHPGDVAACIGLSFVVSEMSCFNGEPTNSYSCYFARLAQLQGRHGIRMLDNDLRLYECLAYNKDVGLPRFRG